MSLQMFSRGTGIGRLTHRIANASINVGDPIIFGASIDEDFSWST